MTEFGDYKLLRVLGEGHSTKVYLAEHTSTGEVYALKLINQTDEAWIEELLEGVRRGAALSHPNIAHLQDWGIVDGTAFIVSEYVHGRDIQKVAERGFDEGRFFPVPLAVSVIASLSGGVHYAHTRKDSDGNSVAVFHEDIRPANVIIGQGGNVKITDFAIGNSLRSLSPLPGRLSYLSPEQIDVDYGPVDARTDVFSIGVVAYELITCKRLFRGETDEDTYEKVLTLPIMPPHHLRVEVEPALSEIIMKALDREPTLRYQSVRDFQMALVDWLSSQDSHTTDAHLAAYISSLFPELDDEKQPEESAALVISEQLFQQMDASSGVNFEKWAEEQSELDKAESEAVDSEKENLSFRHEVPNIKEDGIPKIEESSGIGTSLNPGGEAFDAHEQDEESEPQHTQDFIDELISNSDLSTPPKSQPKKIELADLPMPTLSFPPPASAFSRSTPEPATSDEFDAPPTVITKKAEEAEQTRSPLAEPEIAPFDSSHTQLVENESIVDEQVLDPSNLAQVDPQNTEAIRESQPAEEPVPESSISAEIQGVGPHGFRPPHGSPYTESQVEYSESQSGSNFNDIDEWKPSSNKKGLLVGLGFIVILGLFGGGIWLATHGESTLEKDVGGKKIDPSLIKSTLLEPEPQTILLAVNTQIESVRYIVNGKLKDVKDGAIPIYKGTTNEVVAMAPGYVPKMENVTGEEGVAPLSFDLTPIELEKDSELQLVSEPRGANVFVDGVNAGTTPTTIKLSSRLEHHVEISASGRQTHAAFIGLIPGKNNLIDVKLESEKGPYVGVNFAALPRGTTIKVDGKGLGITPMFKKQKRNKILRVDFSQIDSLPTTRRIALVDVGSFDSRPFLKKIIREKGTLSLSVIPKGADIYIGSNGYGIGPIKKLKHRAGPVRVILDSAQGRIVQMIDVEAKKHTKFTLRLSGGKVTVQKKVLKK